MVKNLKITNKKQIEKLVAIMKQNPDIGRGKLPFGCNKSQLKDKWEEFTVQLNGLGPPIRSANEWQRVWTHRKANLKRKLAANKKNFVATGGGMPTTITLNAIEQSTVELVSMHTQINPNGCAIGLQRYEETDSAESSLNSDAPFPIVECVEKQLPTSSNRQENEVDDERLEILKTQAKNQKEILKTLKNMVKYSYKSYEINKKMYDLKKKKTELQVKLMKAKLKLINNQMRQT